MRDFATIHESHLKLTLTAGKRALYFRFFDGILMSSFKLYNIDWYKFNNWSI